MFSWLVQTSCFSRFWCKEVGRCPILHTMIYHVLAIQTDFINLFLMDVAVISMSHDFIRSIGPPQIHLPKLPNLWGQPKRNKHGLGNLFSKWAEISLLFSSTYSSQRIYYIYIYIYSTSIYSIEPWLSLKSADPINWSVGILNWDLFKVILTDSTMVNHHQATIWDNMFVFSQPPQPNLS